MSSFTTPQPVRKPPVQIAPETFVIQATYGEGVAPVVVHLNAMVIRGAEPVVVDTGCAINREQYLEDLFGLVEPADVRWVFLSHEDADHCGNLHEVMAACPHATLVTTWFMTDRLAVDRLDVPPTRWRWVGNGESFDAGDRRLAALRPPLYDAPTTRGLFDSTTGVYWASDCYASPVPAATEFVADLDPDFWADGFATFQSWNSPWVSLVDRDRFSATCRQIEQIGVTNIATVHGPTIGPAHIERAFEMLRAMPDCSTPPQPGQPMLDELIAQAIGADGVEDEDRAPPAPRTPDPTPPTDPSLTSRSKPCRT